MKITFTLPETNLSGGTKIALEYAHYLRERGHEVTCLVPRPKRRDLKACLRDILQGRRKKFVPAAAAHTWGKNLNLIQPDRRGPLLPDDFPEADIVLGTWWETMEWIRDLPSSKGVKAHFVQGHEVFDGLPLDRVRAVYRLECAKIAVSEWLKRVLQDEYQAGSVAVVPNGVDLERFKPANDGRNPHEVGLVWSHLPLKNSMMAIEAVEKARERLPDLRLTVFGGGASPQACRDRSWITYLPAPPQTLIPSIYAGCSLWLFPSIAEGFGLPILEALACGTPVVATHAGAAPQLIDGSNGRLIECNADQMADAIVELLGLSPAAFESLSIDARASAMRLDWLRSAEQFEEALQVLMAA